MSVISATKDEALPEELFTAPPIDEGAQVYDEKHNPPLRYKYKKNFSQEEWAQILADGVNRQEAVDRRVKIRRGPATQRTVEK
jgi:hypothetical protein